MLHTAPDPAIVISAHDDEIARGCEHGSTDPVRRACRAERDRRVARDAADAADLTPQELARELRDVATMERSPIYWEAALRRRAPEVGVEVPADFGTAMELVPREERPNVVWARRVGDATFTASTTARQPHGAYDHELVHLSVFDRRYRQGLGWMLAGLSRELADEMVWLRHEPAADLVEARELVDRELDDLRWRGALRASSDRRPHGAPLEVTPRAHAAGARVRLPLWFRGEPYRPLTFASAAAAQRDGWHHSMLVTAEGPLGQVPTIVIQPGINTALTTDGHWVSYAYDPRSYPELVRRADPHTLERLAASLRGRRRPTLGNSAHPDVERRTIRRSLADLHRAAQQFGFELFYTSDKTAGGERIPTGATVVLQRFIRGVGTELIGKFRVTRGGDYARSWNGEHIETELESGYAFGTGHPDDWRFYADGVPASPHDDPYTPWALFGAYETAPTGERFRHTQVHARQAERAGMYAAQAKVVGEQFAEARRLSLAEADRRFFDRFAAPAAVLASAAPREPRAARPLLTRPVVSDAEMLRAELTRRQGSVIERGVRVIGPDRFKSYFETLADAVRAVGGDAARLHEEVRRGEVEVITEEGGYGGARGLHGDPRSAIIEYVVHSGLSIRPEAGGT